MVPVVFVFRELTVCSFKPNIALGLELARKGHNVTVMGLEKYKYLIQQQHPSIHYAPLVDSNLWKMAHAFSDSNGADFIKVTTTYTIDSRHELTNQYMDASRNMDVLIGSHSAMLMLHHLTVAQALQKPLVFLTHDLTLPTSSYSFNPVESRVRDYGYISNIMNHRLFAIIFGAAVTFGRQSKWRMLRNDFNLTTPWPFMELFSPTFLADFPVVTTADPTLWPPPPDRPSHWVSTGYFVTRDDSIELYPRHDELQDWINERKDQYGRPLLYFGQGSFSHHEQEVFTDILLNALDGLQMDSISLRNTLDNRDLSQYDNIMVVDQLYQDVIFPQCNVVAHHGGAGSASQCLRSGRPGLCIPAMPFQEVWCGQLQDYGAGVTIYPREMITAWEKNGTNILIRAIKKVMTPEVQEAARKLGQTVENTGGVEQAANVIVQHMEDLRQRKLLLVKDSSESEQESEL